MSSPKTVCLFFPSIIFLIIILTLNLWSIIIHYLIHFPFSPPLTLKVPEKLQLYELYVYYVVHICDFGMLRVNGNMTQFACAPDLREISSAGGFCVFDIRRILWKFYNSKPFSLEIRKQKCNPDFIAFFFVFVLCLLLGLCQTLFGKIVLLGSYVIRNWVGFGYLVVVTGSMWPLWDLCGCSGVYILLFLPKSPCKFLRDA